MIKASPIYVLLMVFSFSVDVLLRIFSIEFYFIFIAYLILLVCLGELLGGPHIFTLFIRFYYIFDDVVCSNRYF